MGWSGISFIHQSHLIWEWQGALLHLALLQLIRTHTATFSMPAPVISPAERDYITQGVEYDCRADGRGRLEYRHLVLETGILSQTSGSARCRLGDSDVLVGVKVEIGEIEQGQPDQGRIVCNVEW